MDGFAQIPVEEPDLSQLKVPPSLLPAEIMPVGFDHGEISSNVPQRPANASNSPPTHHPANTSLVLSKEEVAACFDDAIESSTPGLGPVPGPGGTRLRRLKSGVRFNYRSSQDEPQRAFLRLSVPGGRAAEADPNGPNAEWGPGLGSIALGARTMQEGGALGGLSRTQVELFCVDQVGVACNTTDPTGPASPNQPNPTNTATRPPNHVSTQPDNHAIIHS